MKNEYILSKKSEDFSHKCPVCNALYSLVNNNKETICIKCGERIRNFDILNSHLFPPLAKEIYLY
ncbi:MAG: hypothetical protein ACE5SW_09910 [Nitrososphaeraceae archaeon]